MPTPEESQSKIDAIRRKPVEKMTGKELAFIYKHGDITPEEKKMLRRRVEEKKSADKAKKVGSAAPSPSPRPAAAPVPNTARSSEVSDIKKMMSSRPAPRYELELEEASTFKAPRYTVSDDDELFSSPVPSDTPSARDISESEAQVVDVPKKSAFKRIKSGMVKVIHEPVVVIAVVILLFMVLFARFFFVPSGSMRPTLMEGDRIVSIAQYFPSGSTYQRGDIVCFTAPNNTVYVKRVIGVGGDHIQISGEKVYVNGEESPYQGTGGVMTSMDVQLADDEYWVMGDNRGNSEDSRFIGPIKADKMISKVIAIYLPSEHATFL